MLTRVSSVSTRGSDHQANTVGKNIDPVVSLRPNKKDGNENFVRRPGEGTYVQKDNCYN